MTIKRSPYVAPPGPNSSSVTSGWADSVRAENTAEISADIEATRASLRRGGVTDPTAADPRAQLRAAQDALKNLAENGLTT